MAVESALEELGKLRKEARKILTKIKYEVIEEKKCPFFSYESSGRQKQEIVTWLFMVTLNNSGYYFNCWERRFKVKGQTTSK